MIDHLGISVADLARSKNFYDKALAPLGVGIVMTVTPEMTGGGSTVLGYGPTGATAEGLQTGKPSFWIGDDSDGAATQPHIHVAFTAAERAQVDAFHAAAMAAGGRDNGGPGLRAIYHPNYYAAFVIDPDGHNIEAVCHKPA